jgi:hypothetical protein
MVFMSGSPFSSSPDNTEQNAAPIFQLPLAAMVRALCRAAPNGSDMLYDVMLKLALMIDATAQTYGLATFAQKPGERPYLKWVEGLDQDEIAEAESVVAETLLKVSASAEMKAWRPCYLSGAGDGDGAA